MIADVRMLESGYKRQKYKICDKCGSNDLDYSIKGWIKCVKCGRLFSKKHKFEEMIE